MQNENLLKFLFLNFQFFGIFCVIWKKCEIYGLYLMNVCLSMLVVLMYVGALKLARFMSR